MYLLLAALIALTPTAAGTDVEETASRAVESGAQAGEASPRNWYFSIGGMNYYPLLHESGEKIDHKINNRFGWLPRWQNPTTFADWRDRHKLWGANLGVGRDLSPKTTLFLWAGGTSATIKNRKNYGPLGTDIRFTSTSLFVAPELLWYPRGKVEHTRLTGKRGGDWVRAALSGTKPFLGGSAGYTVMRVGGTAKFSLPLFGTVLREKERDVYHIFMCNPRLGIEIPVSRRSSVTASAAYFFYINHSREYNGPRLALSYQLRF